MVSLARLDKQQSLSRRTAFRRVTIDGGGERIPVRNKREAAVAARNRHLRVVLTTEERLARRAQQQGERQN